MNPRHPDVLERKHQIIELLMSGMPAPEVAKTVGLDRSRVYSLCRTYGYPTNRHIKPMAGTEIAILKALNDGYPIEEVGAMFSQAPCRIQGIIDRVAKHAERLAGRGRFAGEEAASSTSAPDAAE